MSYWWERGLSGIRGLVGRGGASAADERPHPAVGDDPAWGDRFQFAFHDAASGLAGAARLDLRPMAREVRADLVIFLPDGTAAWLADSAHPFPRKGIVGGKLVFRPAEPMKRWEILYQGPLVVADPSSESEGPGRARKIKADLLIQWEAEGPVLDLAGAVDAASRQRLEAAGAFPAGHYAQTGRFVGGHAQIGRSRVDFKSADAHRSHDWGAARDEAPAARLFARIAPDLVIDAVRVGAAGDAYAVGGLWSGGKPSALGGLEMREEGGAAPRLALTARDRRGQALQVDAALNQPVNTAAEGKPEHLWALARLDVGGREGVGVVELSGRA